jgi:hypothetical protein
LCGFNQSSRIIYETDECRSFVACEGGTDGKADTNRVGGKKNLLLSNSGLETCIKVTNASLY